MSLRPSWPGSLLAVVLIALFLALGNWQQERALSKEARIEAFESAGHAYALPEPEQASPGLHLRLAGQFDTVRHTLADNQVYKGRPGVHVYTPFITGGRTVLVNRGWLPIGIDRRNLPGVPSTAGPGQMIEISGRLANVPGVGRPLGEALQMSRDRWPQLVTYPDLGRIANALETELFPLILLLDADSLAGFEDRNWSPVYLSPEKHRAYAFQWFALAFTVAAGWLLLSIRRVQPNSTEHQ